MKRKVITFIIAFALTVMLCACQKAVIEKTPISSRYTPAHETVETTYDYKYDIFSERGFKLMPVVRSVHHPERWELLYRVTYEDGTQADIWFEVTEIEYIEYKEKL